MSNAIPLPPLPVPETWDKRYTADQLRVRDQEIVRCVLQAAAKALQDARVQLKHAKHAAAFDAATVIVRTLEFTHHE
jgi:hypothetical protein